METVAVEKQTTNLVVVKEPETVLVDNKQSITVQNTAVYTATIEQAHTLVAEEQVLEHVVQGGLQGPPGIPGTSTQFEYIVAGSTLGGNRAVTVDSIGQLVYPDTSLTNCWFLGITKHSAVVGQLTEVQILGTQQEPSWSWNPGEPVFLGLNGTLTQVTPTSGQVIVVGVAQTPTKIFIERQPPIYMG
jgi:hypothetical protein